MRGAYLEPRKTVERSPEAGVYQALHEAGIEPDWIIGTSIRAINAALERDDFSSNRQPALASSWSMIFFRKPVSTFRDHALIAGNSGPDRLARLEKFWRRGRISAEPHFPWENRCRSI
jgi:predicted acylesterase/phospholipase RssA